MQSEIEAGCAQGGGAYLLECNDSKQQKSSKRARQQMLMASKTWSDITSLFSSLASLISKVMPYTAPRINETRTHTVNENLQFFPTRPHSEDTGFCSMAKQRQIYARCIHIHAITNCLRITPRSLRCCARTITGSGKFAGLDSRDHLPVGRKLGTRGSEKVLDSHTHGQQHNREEDAWPGDKHAHHAVRRAWGSRVTGQRAKQTDHRA
jgi:hypothetical protein